MSRTIASHRPLMLLMLLAGAACGAQPVAEPAPAASKEVMPGLAPSVAPEAPPEPAPSAHRDGDGVEGAAPAPLVEPIAGNATASVPARKGAPTITVDKTAFRITLPDGHTLTDAEIVGVVLTVRDESNAWRKIRVEAIQSDPRDPEITLYDVVVQNPTTSAWGPLCGPGPDGLTLAMPVAGVWTAAGRHEPSAGAFNITCTSGAIGKCVRFGYKPWATAKDGTPLWDYHQACVRMVRGDYCGDGTPFTKNGMRINIDDHFAIQSLDTSEPLVFEAAWGPDGALCVHHPRVPENVTLAALEARCPDHLRGRTGEACTRALIADDPRLRIVNHSQP